MSSASFGPSVVDELAVCEHVGPVGEGDRALRALLDEEDGDAPLADLLDLEDRVDELGREAERRLVEQQHVRPRDQGARDCELLLLAAGERPGLAPSKGLDDREEGGDPGEVVVPASVVRRPANPSRRFSSTVRFA